jgi:hypothetical protein
MSNSREELSWYRVVLSFDDIAAGRHIALLSAFNSLLVSAGFPSKGTAILEAIDHDSEHVYYFTPDAAAMAAPLIAHYSGVACAAPGRSSVKPHLTVDPDLSGIPFGPESKLS